MSGANVSPIGRNKEEWLVQATDYRKLNEPPRPRLQRNGTIYLMARPPLLCQGGDFAFPAGCPRRPCPADDLWVTLSPSPRSGIPAHSVFLVCCKLSGEIRTSEIQKTSLPIVFTPCLKLSRFAPCVVTRRSWITQPVRHVGLLSRGLCNQS